MRRRRADPPDPTVPSYLPPWPTEDEWPKTLAEARHMVDAMQPRPNVIRRIVVALAAVAAIALLGYISMPLAVALPLVCAFAAGVAGSRHRRRARARR